MRKKMALERKKLKGGKDGEKTSRGKEIRKGRRERKKDENRKKEEKEKDGKEGKILGKGMVKQ